jgi:predicted alpha/beta-hydrolase family hydrolase
MISILLTHGAGSDANSKFLVELDEALTAEGAFVRRYTLPFRQLGKMPNPKVAVEDREGLRQELERLRTERGGTIVAAGHSYGGRQITMLASEQPEVADRIVAMSYPLHPPNKPGQLRTQHFPTLLTPLLIVQGTRDEFGSREELELATQQIRGPKQLVFLEGERHSFRRSAIVTVAKAIYQFASV